MSVLVLVEHDGKTIKDATLATVTAASRLGDVDALVVGHDAEGAAEAAAKIAGVGKVYVASSPALEHQLAEAVAPIAARLMENHDAFVVPATTTGKNIAPRVAALLDVMQVTDILSVEGPDTFTRPIYAGNAIATVKSKDAKKVITVRTTAFEKAAADGGAGTVEQVDAAGDPGTSSFVSAEASESERPELTSAKVIVSGGRAFGSSEQFHALLDPLADKLGAGVAKALLGKPVLPDDLPFVTGGIGLLGTQPSYKMMEDCDTLLMVGSGFPYTEFLPEEGKARGVQIDIDPRMLSLRYPMEVNLVGDSATTLTALLPLRAYKKDRSFRDDIEHNIAKWEETLAKRAAQDAMPINPQRVFAELSPRLPNDAMLACDTGTTVHWYARDLKIRTGMRAAHSGTLASMGAAIPYAVAAKFAHPELPALCFVGDGAMQMNGINELITVARYWKRWRDPRFVVLVMNNRDLNMVTWEQRILAGDRKFEASQELPDFPYAAYARSIGLGGFRLDDSDRIVVAIEDALAAGRPYVLEVVCDPNVPPLPPHVSAKQIRNYLVALAKGDRDAVRMVRASIKQIFA